jgi:putative transposase
MEVTYKCRVYPTKYQKELLAKTFGCCRYVYNYFLNQRITEYKLNDTSLNYSDNSFDLTTLKEVNTWLKEVDSHALQYALKNLDKAYKYFFNSGSGFPKFKSKKTHRYSYTTTNQRVTIEDKFIKIPKVGKLKKRDKRKPLGRLYTVTVKQESSCKYYVCLTFTDINPVQLQKTGKTIGLDMGIKDFCITSKGDKYPNHRYLQQSLDKLAKLQVELSRKTRGSNNWNKQRIKIARLQEHIANQRKDTAHKLSAYLIVNYDIICVETLKVKNMMKQSNLALQIADVGWSQFISFLSYKSNWYTKKLFKIDTFYPSSQLCNVCNFRNPFVKDLSVREWVCPKCNTKHDRDINSAINIEKEGLRLAFSNKG